MNERHHKFSHTAVSLFISCIVRSLQDSSGDVSPTDPSPNPNAQTHEAHHPAARLAHESLKRNLECCESELLADSSQRLLAEFRDIHKMFREAVPVGRPRSRARRVRWCSRAVRQADLGARGVFRRSCRPPFRRRSGSARSVSRSRTLSPTLRLNATSAGPADAG